MSRPKRRIPSYTKEEIETTKAAALEMLFQEALTRPLLHPQPKPDNIAPEGFIWICGACGKTAKDKFNGKDGWDESCMMNSVLVKDNAS